jgi:hypothetical protein
MTPTNKLRFVERVVPLPEHGEGIGKTVRVLQQWWEQSRSMNLGWGEIPLGEAKGEWRDVPLEVE